MTIYFCCDDNRRDAVRAHPVLNGIDFVEVEDDETMAAGNRQRFLDLTLLKTPSAALTPDNIRIEGGESVRNIRVTSVTGTGRRRRIEVDRPGDFSPYTLRLVVNLASDAPPAGYDPILSAVDFSFKVNCDTDFDCADDAPCPPEVFVEPQINYLARDFNSLRRVMVDRLHALAPDWQEDHLADFMQVMVDLKAYVADYQHYQLDAINTEAYLMTARSRVSVRRHARLVDYAMHDGCAARVWAQVRIKDEITAPVTLPAGTQLLTRVASLTTSLLTPSGPEQRAALETALAFETLHEAVLHSAHNQMCFYTWSDTRCVLPRGATRATLAGAYPDLKAGDVLIFEEIRGAITGDEADANPANRFAVRLIAAPVTEDPITTPPTALTEIFWHPDDALPAPLCLSSDAPDAPTAPCGGAISVALGNIVLAQHGKLIPLEDLGTVPANSLFFVNEQARCDPDSSKAVPPRFKPRLQEQNVSQQVPYTHPDPSKPAKLPSASVMLMLDPAQALPAISLANDAAFAGPTWAPQRDLLNSDADAREFVLEVDNDGTARLRFGDDQNGRRPDANASPAQQFYARYRVGAGLTGNIGSDALGHVVTSIESIASVRNPIPAAGGAAPEPIEAVRQNAPRAFRTQERAVTPADYEAVALRFAGVQRAMATLRWTGSWYTVFLTVDRVGGGDVTPAFEAAFRAHMNAYRMMGYDLEIDAPQYAPLEIRIEVCVQPDYFRSSVERALREVYSAGVLRDGTKGLFHPDNFTFGQTVYLSKLYATGAGVPGVQSLEVTVFQVQDQPSRSGLADGQITLSRLEIAQLENDRSFPKRGVLALAMKGGK